MQTWIEFLHCWPLSENFKHFDQLPLLPPSKILPLLWSSWQWPPTTARRGPRRAFSCQLLRTFPKARAAFLGHGRWEWLLSLIGWRTKVNKCLFDDAGELPNCGTLLPSHRTSWQESPAPLTSSSCAAVRSRPPSHSLSHPRCCRDELRGRVWHFFQSLMLPSAWPLQPHQGYARKYRNIQSNGMFMCGRIYYIFFWYRGIVKKEIHTIVYWNKLYSSSSNCGTNHCWMGKPGSSQLDRDWQPPPWHILATFCPIDSHKVASL